MITLDAAEPAVIAFISGFSRDYCADRQPWILAWLGPPLLMGIAIVAALR
jgi:hypothetical protein